MEISVRILGICSACFTRRIDERELRSRGRKLHKSHFVWPRQIYAAAGTLLVGLISTVVQTTDPVLISIVWSSIKL